MNLHKKNTHIIYIDSSNLKCKFNAIQTFQIIQYLKKNGHHVLKEPTLADYIIVTTCGFSLDYENKTIHLLKAISKISKKKCTILVIGCLTKINNDVLKRLPDVEIIENSKDLDHYFYQRVRFHQIQKAFFDKSIFISQFGKKSWEQNRYTAYKIALTKVILERLKWKRMLRFEQIFNEATSEKKVYVQISSGCKQQCSYCIIKKAKGKLVSRPVHEIMTDIKEAWKPGKILSLTGDECGAYGSDINTNLFNLVHIISKTFTDIPIDLVYIYPGWLEQFPDQYVNMFKNNYIYSANIPIQSGSQKILTLMNRNYDIKKVLDIIRCLKKESPHTFFWTHYIVGFNNETWKDFYKTILTFSCFHYNYIFKYTPRPGTNSFELPDNVSPLTKSLRRIISLCIRNIIYIFQFLGLIK
jgi:MiaB/RimO family radical SAM methylthiotransferase